MLCSGLVWQDNIYLPEAVSISCQGEDLAMETMIGRVTHYYPKVGVAVVVLEDHLAFGDLIHIKGPSDDFHQTVGSMEIDHEKITDADKGDDIGIKVNQRAHPGDSVYRET